MDLYYQHCEGGKQVADLQLTAVTCFFVAAKNIMVEPFTLEEAMTVLCYGKYTLNQFLHKEQELRKLLDYQNELANYLDFGTLFVKLIKLEFLKQHKAQASTKVVNCIIKSSVDFFNQLETIMYDLCKLALVDGYLKRYLKSYVGAALLLLAFDKLSDKVLGDNKTSKAKDRPKYDLVHFERAYSCLNAVFSSYFGFNKFIFLQVLANFLNKRFSIFYFQYSGILIQRKAMYHESVEMGTKITEKHLRRLTEKYNTLPYLFKDRIQEFLYDDMLEVDEFWQQYIPNESGLRRAQLSKFEWNCSMDVFNSRNDSKVHA